MDNKKKKSQGRAFIAKSNQKMKKKKQTCFSCGFITMLFPPHTTECIAPGSVALNIILC